VLAADPVSAADLARWHGENPNYRPHITACCGGAPGWTELRYGLAFTWLERRGVGQGKAAGLTS